MKKDLTKNVISTLDSNAADIRMFENIPRYEGNISNEIKPPLAPNCFLGAYYRKVFSSKDNWLGIEGVITLGEFTPDNYRFGTDNRVYYERELDSPSIYMGGQSITESDAGLGYMIGYQYKGQDIELNYGTPKVAYRPFWRYIYSTALDVNGNVERNNINSWNVSNPLDFDFYYFPGDKIKMSVYSPKQDYLQLRIELLEETTIEKYAKIREGFQLERKPRTFLSPLFYSEGHGYSPAEFKRVNSLDQYGNEGFVVKNTKATVSKAVWHETHLLRNIDNKIQKVIFDENRSSRMTCPNNESFLIKELENGGEEITITPNYRDN